MRAAADMHNACRCPHPTHTTGTCGNAATTQCKTCDTRLCLTCTTHHDPQHRTFTSLTTKAVIA